MQNTVTLIPKNGSCPICHGALVDDKYTGGKRCIDCNTAFNFKDHSKWGGDQDGLYEHQTK